MPTRKRYREWTPDQSYLLPPSPRDWLDDGHLVYFLIDLVRELDVSAIEDAIQAKDARGERPYDPRMMVGLLLYAYCVGIFSSRRIERATYSDVAFRVLTGGAHPHFTCICTFRRKHLEALSGLFVQVLSLCRKAGLVKLGHVAIDGTKIQANASKHKAMSYERMLAAEKRLTTKIEELMKRAEGADQSDDERLGPEGRDDDLPDELKRQEQRLAVIRKAKAELEAEARKARAARRRELAEGCDERAENADEERRRKLNETLAHKHREAADELDDDDSDDPPFTTPEGLPMHRPKTRTDGAPDPKAQRNFTDPDSRIMESNGTFLQGYNCQAAVDSESQIIVGKGLTNQAPDAGNLGPLLDDVVRHCGEAPVALTGDSGYWCAEVDECCARHGTTAYISTERRRHWDDDHTVTQGPAPDDAPPRDRMRHRVRTVEGRAIYARRKVIVEPVFGQMKEGRGFRRFLLRGIERARGEWDLMCLTHNILKLFRGTRVSAVGAPTPTG